MLLAPLSYEQKEMPVRGLNVQDSHFRISLMLAADLEELPGPVLSYVQGDDPRGRRGTPSWMVGDFDSCADTGELRQQVVDVHS
jgi:hypothetical protein